MLEDSGMNEKQHNVTISDNCTLNILSTCVPYKDACCQCLKCEVFAFRSTVSHDTL